MLKSMYFLVEDNNPLEGIYSKFAKNLCKTSVDSL